MSLQNKCCLQIGRREFRGLSHTIIFSQKDIFACPRLGAWHVFQPLMSINFGGLFAKCIFFRMENTRWNNLKHLQIGTQIMAKKTLWQWTLKVPKWKIKNRQCWTETSKSWLSLTLTRWNMNLSASWNPCYQYIQRICTCVYIYISLYNYMTWTLVP